MKWFGLATMIFTVAAYGYITFLPGWWDLGAFSSYYTDVLRLPGSLRRVESHQENEIRQSRPGISSQASSIYSCAKTS